MQKTWFDGLVTISYIIYNNHTVSLPVLCTLKEMQSDPS